MKCDKELQPLAEALQELAQCGALEEILRQAGVLPPGWGALNKPSQTHPGGCASCAAAGKQITEVPYDPMKHSGLPHLGRIEEEE